MKLPRKISEQEKKKNQTIYTERRMFLNELVITVLFNVATAANKSSICSMTESALLEPPCPA